MSTVEVQRVQSVAEKLSADGFDALVVSKGSDIKYLTGFTGEYGVAVMVISPKESFMVTDSRFETQAAAETQGLTIQVYPTGSPTESSYYGHTGAIIRDMGFKRVGIYSGDLAYGEFKQLQTVAPEAVFEDAPEYITEMRAVKTPEELELILKACWISQRSFYALLDFIKPGVTEAEVAHQLDHLFHTHGGDGWCFPTIVASGPNNGACPHASVSDRKIEYGDFVTIDFGTYYKGYCSDITRTILVGDKPKEPELLECNRIVNEAKKVGESMLKPGAVYSDICKAIRATVEKYGYVIPHGPGHNFGLDIHEAPFLTNTNPDVEKPGMTHTIEPGIYLPGVGGIRQEDDYLITEDGYERLTNISDALIVL